MFERYTDRARQVVALASDEARALKHNYIGTEHILLGLLREEDGLGSRVLTGLGVEVDETRDAVEKLVGKGDEAVAGEIPFTPRSKKVLELALREALCLGHNYIGTEHLLMGLVRENEGVATRILSDRGIDLDGISAKVIDTLKGQPRDKPLAEYTEYNNLRVVAGPDDPFDSHAGVLVSAQENAVRVVVRKRPGLRVVLDGTFYLDLDAGIARGIADAVKKLEASA